MNSTGRSSSTTQDPNLSLSHIGVWSDGIPQSLYVTSLPIPLASTQHLETAEDGAGVAEDANAESLDVNSISRSTPNKTDDTTQAHLQTKPPHPSKLYTDFQAPPQMQRWLGETPPEAPWRVIEGMTRMGTSRGTDIYAGDGSVAISFSGVKCGELPRGERVVGT